MYVCLLFKIYKYCKKKISLKKLNRSKILHRCIFQCLKKEVCMILKNLKGIFNIYRIHYMSICAEFNICIVQYNQSSISVEFNIISAEINILRFVQEVTNLDPWTTSYGTSLSLYLGGKY